MSSQTSEKPIGFKVKEEQIAKQELPVFDCGMMDARSRKLLLYLIEAEKKRYKSYPKSWVKQPVEELENLKTAIEMCRRVRQKQVQNAAAE